MNSKQIIGYEILKEEHVYNFLRMNSGWVPFGSPVFVEHPEPYGRELDEKPRFYQAMIQYGEPPDFWSEENEEL
jgi:hypothetical protein